MEAQGSEITALEYWEREKLINVVSGKTIAFDGNNTRSDTDRSRQAVSYIDDYKAADIYVCCLTIHYSKKFFIFQKVKFRPVSEIFWDISGDSLLALKATLNEKNGTLPMHIEYIVQRERAKGKEPIIHSTQFNIQITPSSPPGVWDGLIQALNISGGESSFVSLPLSFSHLIDNLFRSLFRISFLSS